MPPPYGRTSMQPGRSREKGRMPGVWVASRRREHEDTCRQRGARQSHPPDRLPRQRNDIAFAHALVANAAIADKSYDADHLCDRLDSVGNHRTPDPTGADRLDARSNTAQFTAAGISRSITFAEQRTPGMPAPGW